MNKNQEAFLEACTTIYEPMLVIAEKIVKMSKKRWSVGKLYAMADSLEQQGFVEMMDVDSQKHARSYRKECHVRISPAGTQKKVEMSGRTHRPTFGRLRYA